MDFLMVLSGPGGDWNQGSMKATNAAGAKMVREFG